MEAITSETEAMERARAGGSGYTRSLSGDIWRWTIVRDALVIDKPSEKVYTEITEEERLRGR